MNRRNFLTTTVATAAATAATSSFFLLLFPHRSAKAEKFCLRALEGVDVESIESPPEFNHFHQLVIPVSDIVNPPKNGIPFTTYPVDQGSFDAEGLEAFTRRENGNLYKNQTHNHIGRITREELLRISRGEKNVEIKVYTRETQDKPIEEREYVHSFLVTAPPSLLAIVKKERKQ